jgi:uncharacterized protein
MIAVDTGYLLALLDHDDAHHARAMRLLPTQNEGWMTTWAVIGEAFHMIERRVHRPCAMSLFDSLDEGELLIWDIPHHQYAPMHKLMKKYENLPMDLADASMVLLAEHLGHGRILTVDERDFGVYRWKSQKPFVDLMAELT